MAHSIHWRLQCCIVLAACAGGWSLTAAAATDDASQLEPTPVEQVVAPPRVSVWEPCLPRWQQDTTGHLSAVAGASRQPAAAGWLYGPLDGGHYRLWRSRPPVAAATTVWLGQVRYDSAAPPSGWHLGLAEERRLRWQAVADGWQATLVIDPVTPALVRLPVGLGRLQRWQRRWDGELLDRQIGAVVRALAAGQRLPPETAPVVTSLEPGDWLAAAVPGGDWDGLPPAWRQRLGPLVAGWARERLLRAVPWSVPGWRVRPVARWADEKPAVGTGSPVGAGSLAGDAAAVVAERSGAAAVPGLAGASAVALLSASSWSSTLLGPVGVGLLAGGAAAVVERSAAVGSQVGAGEVAVASSEESAGVGQAVEDLVAAGWLCLPAGKACRVRVSGPGDLRLRWRWAPVGDPAGREASVALDWCLRAGGQTVALRRGRWQQPLTLSAGSAGWPVDGQGAPLSSTAEARLALPAAAMELELVSAERLWLRIEHWQRRPSWQEPAAWTGRPLPAPDAASSAADWPAVWEWWRHVLAARVQGDGAALATWLQQRPWEDLPTPQSPVDPRQEVPHPDRTARADPGSVELQLDAASASAVATDPSSPMQAPGTGQDVAPAKQALLTDPGSVERQSDAAPVSPTDLSSPQHPMLDPRQWAGLAALHRAWAAPQVTDWQALLGELPAAALGLRRLAAQAAWQAGWPPEAVRAWLAAPLDRSSRLALGRARLGWPQRHGAALTGWWALRRAWPVASCDAALVELLGDLRWRGLGWRDGWPLRLGPARPALETGWLRAWRWPPPPAWWQERPALARDCARAWFTPSRLAEESATSGGSLPAEDHCRVLPARVANELPQGPAWPAHATVGRPLLRGQGWRAVEPVARPAGALASGCWLAPPEWSADGSVDHSAGQQVIDWDWPAAADNWMRLELQGPGTAVDFRLEVVCGERRWSLHGDAGLARRLGQDTTVWTWEGLLPGQPGAAGLRCRLLAATAPVLLRLQRGVGAWVERPLSPTPAWGRPAVALPMVADLAAVAALPMAPEHRRPALLRRVRALVAIGARLRARRDCRAWTAWADAQTPVTEREAWHLLRLAAYGGWSGAEEAGDSARWLTGRQVAHPLVACWWAERAWTAGEVERARRWWRRAQDVADADRDVGLGVAERLAQLRALLAPQTSGRAALQAVLGEERTAATRAWLAAVGEPAEARQAAAVAAAAPLLAERDTLPLAQWTRAELRSLPPAAGDRRGRSPWAVLRGGGAPCGMLVDGPLVVELAVRPCWQADRVADRLRWWEGRVTLDGELCGRPTIVAPVIDRLDERGRLYGPAPATDAAAVLPRALSTALPRVLPTVWPDVDGTWGAAAAAIAEDERWRFLVPAGRHRLQVQGAGDALVRWRRLRDLAPPPLPAPAVASGEAASPVAALADPLAAVLWQGADPAILAAPQRAWYDHWSGAAAAAVPGLPPGAWRQAAAGEALLQLVGDWLAGREQDSGRVQEQTAQLLSAIGDRLPPAVARAAELVRTELAERRLRPQASAGRRRLILPAAVLPLELGEAAWSAAALDAALLGDDAAGVVVRNDQHLALTVSSDSAWELAVAVELPAIHPRAGPAPAVTLRLLGADGEQSRHWQPGESRPCFTVAPGAQELRLAALYDDRRHRLHCRLFASRPLDGPPVPAIAAGDSAAAWYPLRPQRVWLVDELPVARDLTVELVAPVQLRLVLVPPPAGGRLVLVDAAAAGADSAADELVAWQIPPSAPRRVVCDGEDRVIGQPRRLAQAVPASGARRLRLRWDGPAAALVQLRYRVAVQRPLGAAPVAALTRLGPWQPMPLPQQAVAPAPAPAPEPAPTPRPPPVAEAWGRWRVGPFLELESRGSGVADRSQQDAVGLGLWWERRWRRVWTQVGVQQRRLTAESVPVTDLRARVQTARRWGAWQLAGQLQFDGHWQAEPQSARSQTLRLRGDLRRDCGADAWLRLRLELGGWQSRVDAPEPDADLAWDVYNDYRRDHPDWWRVEFAGRWQHWRDWRLTADVNLLGNAGGLSDGLDRWYVDGASRWRWRAWSAELALRYLQRLADDHRRRASDEWRTAVAVERGFGSWRGWYGRGAWRLAYAYEWASDSHRLETGCDWYLGGLPGDHDQPGTFLPPVWYGSVAP